jgi:hypothetical protein
VAAALFAGMIMPARADVAWPGAGPQGLYIGLEGGWTSAMTITHRIPSLPSLLVLRQLDSVAPRPQLLRLRFLPQLRKTRSVGRFRVS